LGIALKIIDGGGRALLPATIAVLDQLGLLDEAQRSALAPWGAPEIHNFRGLATGRISPAAVLEKHS
jgi:L-asparaginase II